MKKWYQHWTIWAAIVAAVAGDALASANRNTIHANAVGYAAGALMVAAAVLAVVFVLQYSRAKKAAREADDAAHAAELREQWAQKQADAAAAKAVKTSVSAALPVVGSIVADAASTVTSSAAILRSGIGIVGVVSVAAMCVTPYLQFAVHYVLYKLAAGIAESFADKRVGRLIDGFADVYGFLLGMVGVASLILFLSIVSSMKAVTG